MPKDLSNNTEEVWKELLSVRENVELLKRQLDHELKYQLELEAHYNRLSSIMAEEPSDS